MAVLCDLPFSDQLFKRAQKKRLVNSSVLLSPAAPGGNVVTRAVVLNDSRVVDRDIAGSLVEIAYGIAARVHDLCQEGVRIVN